MSKKNEHDHVDPDQFASEDAESKQKCAADKAHEPVVEPDSSQSDLRKVVHDLEVALKDAKNEALYQRAECENTRIRAKRDVENAHRYGTEKLLAELLPVLDSFEHGLNASDKQDDAKIQSLHEGMALTYTMFLKALEKYGIEQVNPIGQDFDANVHEALSVREEADHSTNTVVEVMQKGYLLNDRIVRRALVVVAK